MLAQLKLSASLLTGARSTGNFSKGELMRVTEPGPKTWFGAVPKITRLMTAIVLLNGSLTNSCHALSGVGVYGFYAAQPYLLQLYGSNDSYAIAGLSAGMVAGAQIVGGVSASYVARA